jgi:GrpB-like predicted nucleotidyltransferase (UPF0157 family)
VPDPVLIVPYDPRWPIQFAELCQRYIAALGDLVVTVEHVGSTAVPGLSAKPILDIDIVVRSTSDVAEAIRRLGTLGYRHLGDLGISGREAFDNPDKTPAYHLYLVVDGSEPHRNHIQFRDYLREHSETVQEYQRLKHELASRFAADRDGYTKAKSEFVQMILRRCNQDEI